MDDNSKAIARSIPGVIRPDGAVRPFARLASIHARLSSLREDKAIEQLFFQFEGAVLEVTGDEEFFTGDRIHLRRLDKLPAGDSNHFIDITGAAGLSSLIGCDLSSLLWMTRAGDIDQFIVLEFHAHKQHRGEPKGSVTIRDDDFCLALSPGAPDPPSTEFDPITLTRRPHGTQPS